MKMRIKDPKKMRTKKKERKKSKKLAGLKDVREKEAGDR
jgi:hypothetical protein